MHTALRIFVDLCETDMPNSYRCFISLYLFPLQSNDNRPEKVIHLYASAKGSYNS